MQNCLTYDAAFELQKTREWSPTPFLKCRVDNSGPHQNGGLGGQHEYWFTGPRFLHISYLHIYHPISKSINSQDTYLVSCGRWVRGSITPDWPKIFSHDHYHISDLWAPKWSELGLKAQNLENLFIRVVSDHKLYTHVKQPCITIKSTSFRAWGMIHTPQVVKGIWNTKMRIGRRNKNGVISPFGHID